MSDVRTGTATGIGQRVSVVLQFESILWGLATANTGSIAVAVSIINPGRYLSTHTQSIVHIIVAST